MRIDRRFLVIKLADLGDVLLTTPALRALRHTYPLAHVTLFTSPIGAELMRGSPLVDDTIVADRHLADSLASLAQPRVLLNVMGLSARLHRQDYDAVLLLHHLSTPFGALKWRAITSLVRAPLKAGLDNGRGSFLNPRLTDQGFGAMHEAEYALAIAAALGASSPDRSLSLTIPPEAEEEAKRLLTQHGLPPNQPFACIHAGSGGYSLARRWPAQRFAVIGDALDAAGLRVVLVGGNGDSASEVRSSMKRHAVDLSGLTSILGLAALLRLSTLFVGNDSGVMHLAAAANCPMVAIFGPSNAKAWGPWRPEAEAARRTIVLAGPCPEGGPCLYTGHSVGLREGCAQRHCLQSITPDQVIAAIRDLHVF